MLQVEVERRAATNRYLLDPDVELQRGKLCCETCVYTTHLRETTM